MSKLTHKSETSAGGIVRKIEEGTVLWLVTQHSQHKGWGFPKGLVGDSVENESMEVAALREVREEGGVAARIVHPVPVEVKYTYRFKDILVDKTVYYFLMDYLSGDTADHDWEVSEAKFLDEDGVRAILTYDTEKEAFAAVLALGKL